ncbi:IscS subfamily cysteine desulfurase [Candidatus Poribacteria bacterium]|nr:IscS subfamily cysteine desulfurase [Candidatus Poribacteria bacterium]
MKLPIYMDHQATTPLDPRVLDAMMPYLTHEFGNAASRNHSWGWHAEQAVDLARQQLADVLNCTPDEVVFTSGATESDNMAVKGIAWAYQDKGNHIITTQTEHKAILDTCKVLEKQGFQVTYLPVDRYGMVSPEDVHDAITDQTILISVIWANNEIGTLNPIAEIGSIAQEAGVLFHTDGVQAFAKYDSDVDRLNVDLMSISGHKIYGPKGVGALYVRKKRPRIKLTPLMDGGGHEKKMRSGTLNVPGIVGLGKAASIYLMERDAEHERVGGLRDRLHERITTDLDFVYLNGHPTERLYSNLNLSFEFVEGESLLMGMKNVGLSSGSACTSASLESSYVLVATGIDEGLAHTSIRFGLGRGNTAEEVEFTADHIVATVKRLRELSPLYEMKLQGIDISKIEWAEDAHH